MYKHLLLTAALVAPMLSAAKSFDLVTEGDQVCKIEAGTHNKTCVNKLAKVWEQFKVPETYEMIDGLNGASKNGPRLYTQAEQTLLLKNFQRISVRNLGIDFNNITKGGTSGKDSIVPFVASVYWVSTIGVNGTINVEGTIVFPQDDNSIQGKVDEKDPASSRPIISQLIHITNISDSSGSEQTELHRWTETLARAAQINLVYGKNVKESEGTVQLLTDYVGPYVFVEAIGPVVEDAINNFGKALGDGLSKAFGN